jgi:NADH-quinone oxidoreductase subunit J
MATNVLMFYLFSSVIIIFALLSIITRRILRAAVYLLFVLVATAGFYFMMQYQFLAAMQLALYAGGIVVLIIFSILLTHHINHKFENPKLINALLGGGIAVGGTLLAIPVILAFPFAAHAEPALDIDMHVIGRQLLETGKNGYALPFEVISILLLASMVAAIVIAKKGK